MNDSVMTEHFVLFVAWKQHAFLEIYHCKIPREKVWFV